MIKHEYKAIPGAKIALTGIMVDSIPGIIVALKTHQMVSDAGLHGSVIVYREDGDYRCLFMASGVMLDQTVCKTETEIAAWLNEWAPRQHDPQPQVQLSEVRGAR